MDEFETELSEMMKSRVAAMPGSYDATPELLARARRRRTTKLSGLVAAVVIVAAGTSAAVVQVTGRNDPHRVSTAKPSFAGPSTSVPPARPSVATVACPVSYSIEQPALPEPSTSRRVPPVGDASLFAHLRSYAGTTDPRYVVLGPAGWSCQVGMSTDGDNGLVVYPALTAAGAVPDLYHAPIAIENDWAFHGVSGSGRACQVSRDPAVIAQAAQISVSCEVPPGRVLTRVDARVTTFVDADGARGLSWLVLPPAANDTVGKISILTCRSAAGLTAADCDTIIADFEARLDPSTAPAVALSSIADAPFAPGDWVTTARGFVIGDRASDLLAAYDASENSWSTLPEPPFRVDRRIFAARGSKVYVTGRPFGRSSDMTPFAVLDTSSGKWQILATVPDGVFGIQSAGDADHLFGVGYFESDFGVTSQPHEIMLEYDVGADRWTKLPASPLSIRANPAVQWTGRELLVWGGGDFHQGGLPAYADGAAYDPATGKWRTLPAPPVPARTGAASVWTGTEMIVWGGSDCNGCGREAIGAGAAYNPTTNGWRKIADSPLPPSFFLSAVWTGTRMVVLSDGSAGRPHAAMYDPAIDGWVALPPPPATPPVALVGSGGPFATYVGGEAIFGTLTQQPDGGVQLSAWRYTLGG